MYLDSLTIRMQNPIKFKKLSFTLTRAGPVLRDVRGRPSGGGRYDAPPPI